VNSLNWREFQPRSLIACYLEYAKLIDLHRLSCFPVMATGRSRWGALGPLASRLSRGPVARLNGEANGVGEGCAGWRF
jgi:hypothetical protein